MSWAALWDADKDTQQSVPPWAGDYAIDERAPLNQPQIVIVPMPAGTYPPDETLPPVTTPTPAPLPEPVGPYYTSPPAALPQYPDYTVPGGTGTGTGIPGGYNTLPDYSNPSNYLTDPLKPYTPPDASKLDIPGLDKEEKPGFSAANLLVPGLVLGGLLLLRKKNRQKAKTGIDTIVRKYKAYRGIDQPPVIPDKPVIIHPYPEELARRIVTVSPPPAAVVHPIATLPHPVARRPPTRSRMVRRPGTYRTGIRVIR
jgi:hypothetical protein